jgi:hypothetical protein
MRDSASFVQYLIWAMEGRGVMHTPEIYSAVAMRCTRAGRALPCHWDAEIRQTLQAHCASRPQYKGRGDFFVYHGRGRWSCKVASPTLDDLHSMISVSASLTHL